MPRAKKHLSEAKATSSSAAANGQRREVLTLAETAAYLRVSESKVLELVRAQSLPGRFTGEEWRFLKAAVEQWLAGSASRKQTQLALAGKYKDDPDLVQICEQAYRQRRGAMTKDE
jgi:excisionase family DNA binding protein